jgi:cell shape-determining protein MreC
MRFNHMFIFIMAVSALSALVLPRGMADGLRSTMDNVLMPVAYPVGSLAGAIDSHFEAPRPPIRGADGKIASDAELRDEVERDRVIIGNLSERIDGLRRQLNENKSLGSIAQYCRRFTVWGAQPGPRNILNITGSSGDGLRDGMAVINSYGMVGRIASAGVGGARVQLITDSRFVAAGAIKRYRPDSRQGYLTLQTPPFTVAGDGAGGLVITNLKRTDVKAAGIREHDWVTLYDHDYPDIVQGLKLGEIVSITEQRRNPLFVEIAVHPFSDLMHLKDVMVVIRTRD